MCINIFLCFWNTKIGSFMKFGYAQVSKGHQSLDIQIQKLEEAGCDKVFSEKVSRAKDDRKQLKELLSRLRSGDTVYVVRLDRLGRRMIKLISLIEDLHHMGV